MDEKKKQLLANFIDRKQKIEAAEKLLDKRRLAGEFKVIQKADGTFDYSKAMEHDRIGQSLAEEDKKLFDEVCSAGDDIYIAYIEATENM